MDDEPGRDGADETAAYRDEYQRGIADRVAAVQREIAEMEALEEAALLKPRRRRQAGPSVVYSVRLDHDEVTALERRAALTGIKPTVLARNLIRVGLSVRIGVQQSEAVGAAVEAVEASVRELRLLVPYADDAAGYR